MQSQPDGIFLPRHVALHCGIPIDRPALGVNRLCGSGFQSIVNGAQDILLGAAKISLTGGVDNMSMAPFIVRNIRFGTGLGTPYAFEDSLWVNKYIYFSSLKPFFANNICDSKFENIFLGKKYLGGPNRFIL